MTLLENASQRTPYLAVAVTGHMERAFAGAGEGKAFGALSQNPIDVVLLADMDMMDDEVVGYYREIDQYTDNIGGFRLMSSLGNVPFCLNVPDALRGDACMMALRNHRLKYRTLLGVESIREEYIRRIREQSTEYDSAAQQRLAELEGEYRTKSADVQKRSDLSLLDQKKLIDSLGNQFQSRVNKVAESARREKQQANNRMQSEQEAELQGFYASIRQGAVIIPASVLFIIIIFVLALRLFSERKVVPDQRRRGTK